MKFLGRAAWVNLAFLLSVLGFLTPLPAIADQPGRESIVSYIQQTLPNGVGIVDLDYKVFDSVTGFSGRVSIAGTVELTENRVKQSRVNHFYDDLLAHGLTQKQFSRYAEQSYGNGAMRSVQFAEYVNFAGVRTPFKAEIGYQETVSGFDFSGRTNFDVCCVAESEFLAGDRIRIVYFSDDYNKLKNEFLAMPKAEERAVAPLFRDIAGGAYLAADAGPVATVSSIDLDRLVWDVEKVNRQTVYRAIARIELTSVSQNPVRINGVKLEPQGSAPAEIILEVNHQTLDPGSACVSIVKLNFATSLGRTCLVNGAFSRSYDGRSQLYEDMAKQALALVPGAAPVVAAKAESSASEPMQAVAVESPFAGDWFTSDRTWRVRIVDRVGTLIDGGDGSRPRGTVILEIEVVNGDSFEGSYVMSNGRWYGVRGSVQGSNLSLSDGRQNWSWVR